MRARAHRLLAAHARWPPIERWQQRLREGDLVVAALRGRGAPRLVWAEVRAARDGDETVRVRWWSREEPDGREREVHRAAAVYPLSAAQFDAARAERWPDERRAVQCLARLVRGGDA